MMTLKERDGKVDSLTSHWRKMSDASIKYLGEVVEVLRYLNENELPIEIRRHVWEAKDARWKLYKASDDLSHKLTKTLAAVMARPCLCEIEDGISIKCKGMLPNHEPTSTDEATALKMYAAYKAAKAFGY